jgi:dienelactone hydrolase
MIRKFDNGLKHLIRPGAALAVAASLTLASSGASGSAASGLPFLAPVTNADGVITPLQARLCRPASSGPARLVVIAHGSNTQIDPSTRAGWSMPPCDSEAVTWFTSRGYAVALFLRRGYGATGGQWAEGPGDCQHLDFTTAAREIARDTDAAVNAATRLPSVRSAGVVVVGKSGGGLGAVAYDAQPHPKVSGFVSMAGGLGGHMDAKKGQNCGVGELANTFATFGAQAATSMLWVYAANDTYFSPAIAALAYRRFTRAGGAADLHGLPPFGQDGHSLFLAPGGSAVWGPIVADYLARMDLTP